MAYPKRTKSARPRPAAWPGNGVPYREPPRVSQYMTRIPYTIQADATLKTAMDRMAEYGVRHLPVTDKGRIVGMLSDRDLKLVHGLESITPEELLVIDACHGPAYVVTPETPLHIVARKMARTHYGSAVVAEGGRLIGIFTTVDACRALAGLIEESILSHA